VSAPLAGRVALVSGAGRGLGRAIAAALAGAGARVVLAARSQPEIEAASRALVQSGLDAQAVAVDVRDPGSVRALVQSVLERCAGLDILVNNAGVFRLAPVAATDDATWDAILDTNLKGAFLLTRAALPALVERRGHIVNMVSTAGRVAYRDNGAYCASKWGLLGLTNVLREELRPAGVRVTAVLPGQVDTPIWDGVPGTWERDRMLRPDAVARIVAEVCALPPGANTDEIVLTPRG
jgi:NAD(P)-dependent dehydrogenase (short-subunit alcohol dehydrogenase family)